jgi:hypothetical protein
VPACPKCKAEHRYRKDDGCPSCGTPITLIEGLWFVDTGHVKEDFVKKWAYLQARRLRVEYFITKRMPSYNRELKHATKLLSEAGDFDTAVRALKLFYTDKRFSWLNANSLCYLFKQWAAAVAVARDQIEREEKEIETSKEAYEELPGLDIFKGMYGSDNS